MRLISDFLSRFSLLKPRETVVIDAFIAAAAEKKLTIRKESITVRGSQVFVQAHPAIKSEIFINKETLLLDANRRLGKAVLTDIR